MDQADKAEHMLAFGSLMFWFEQVSLPLRARLATAGLLVALGVAVEVVQGQTGYRSFEYADMGADCAGIFVGWVLARPRLANLYAWTERFLVTRKQRWRPVTRSAPESDPTVVVRRIVRTSLIGCGQLTGRNAAVR